MSAATGQGRGLPVVCFTQPCPPLLPIANRARRDVDRWRARAEGWLPISDSAHIALRGVDVARLHPPLLGAESTSLEVLSGVRPIYHPGPVESFVLGVAHWFGHGPTPMLAAVVVVDVLAIGATIAAVRRLGGPLAVLWAAVSLAAMGSSLGVQVVGSVWNPDVPLFTLVAGYYVWLAMT